MAKAKPALREFERHPLSAKYGDLVGQQWLDFVDNIKETGNFGRRIVVYKGMILDGWQFYRACKLLGMIPEFADVTDEVDDDGAAALVEAMNDHRRHETAEQMQRRACDRRDRVAQMRKEGKSIRVIAEEEGVSPRTIQTDLESSTVQGDTVEPPDGKTTGKDGKKRSTTRKKAADPLKPPKLCKRCERMGHAFCDKCRIKAEAHAQAKANAAPPDKPEGIDFVGQIYRDILVGIDEIGIQAKQAAEAMKEPNCSEHNGVRRMVLELTNLVNAWHKRAMMKDGSRRK